ncbi:TonB-dependent receptor plug domain-containing protein [Mucilaginibacter sp. HMF7410]|uniref:TonB-dependent receptor plug domain-containing protein n=1 Tax=Mucilaginibacter arboris TaxID=2682090 RepID=A0A7K1SRZ7_9SPHI|nr:TonB-dependent receptor plug domain-containing protein [Mucilaginibacter arboris]
MAFTALLLPFLAAAQFSLSGKITDVQTGETLPNASISIEKTALKTVSDASGNFRFHNLKAGTYHVIVSYIGYQQLQQSVVINTGQSLNFALKRSTVQADEVFVRATRTGQNSGFTYTNLSKKELAKNNLGQDLPYLLNQTPSAVITSDAGAGVGYTGIRIRGSDATRINVTLNGIPLNDAESQGSFFVDIPDLASSVDNIQIQRGVGTSTNGAGAFGASINVQTTTRQDTAYAQLDNSVGSYGTVKNTISLGSGLIANHFTFDGRLSRIHSDGYIDRASSDLKSYFLTGAYYGKNTSIRLNVFSGSEKTYQAWDGVPEDKLLAGDRTYNELGLMPNGDFYKNQTDNYIQNHYQLLFNQKISDKLSFNGALHYTQGSGYYEEYKIAQPFAKYGLTPIIKGVDTTDLVRRLWLTNYFYGVTYNLNYQAQKNLNFTLGGAYNQYRGQHYNRIEWTQQSTNITPDYEYSRNNAFKTDFNIFGKMDYRLGNLNLYADVQYRRVYYSFLGYDYNLNNVQQSATLNFFNPKLGLSYQIDPANNVYASFAVGNHEPNRDDYTQSTPSSRPKAETLYDFEAGYRTKQGVFTGGINGFYMLYHNQLVLTGSLNDVGAAIRSNVKDSYRAGLELDGRIQIAQPLYWSLTAALSANKVKNFQQYLENYDTGQTVLNQQFQKTDIAYSPDFVSSSEIGYSPIKGGEIALISKYVSKQYLDNTSSNDRKLDAFFVNNIRLRYNFSTKAVKNIGISFLINNIFSELYEPNGATYPDIEGGKVVNYNYYYPQATRNFLAALSLRF